MKKITRFCSLIIGTICFNVSALLGQTNCIDFEGGYNTLSWGRANVNSIDVFINNVDLVNSTNYLRLQDGIGGSVAWNNTIEFSGNWITKSQEGCLCFDYRADYDAIQDANCPIGSRVSNVLKIWLYTGTAVNSLSAFSNSTRAVFIPDLNQPIIPDEIWQHYCLPIGLSSNGILPTNGLGQWEIRNGATILTGSAALTAWDNLIQNVTGFVLGTDYNCIPNETISFDNFCWKCTQDSIAQAETCCAIPDLKIDLKEGEEGYILTVDGGTTAIQEVEVSMMDYHVAYNDPQCQPLNMGLLGNITTTTPNLGTLALDTISNGSQSLTWLPGTPATLTEKQINFTVNSPGVLSLPCCEVSFSYCLKVTVKDVDCNVCEKTICFGDSVKPPIVCLDLVRLDSLICKGKNRAGTNTYSAKLTIHNPGDAISGGFSLSCGGISGLPSIIPANSNQVYDVILTSSNPQGTRCCIRFNHEACKDSICFTLPKCSEDSCCDLAFSGPKPATTYCPGDKVNINWTGCVTGGLIHISLIDVTNWRVHQMVASNVSVGAGTFSWTFPADIPCDTGRTWQFYIEDINKKCWQYGPTFKIICCDSCSCGNKISDSIKIITKNESGSIPCGSIINNSEPGSGINIVFPAFNCTGNNCNPSYQWAITGPISANGTGFNITGANYSQPGRYHTVIYYRCDGLLCDSCWFDVTVIAENKDTCSCNKWKDERFVLDNKKLKCGSSVNLSEGNTYHFSSMVYQCDPNNEDCLPVYQWYLDGVYQNSGITYSGSFAATNHILEIIPICGDDTCAPCSINLKVEKQTLCNDSMVVSNIQCAPNNTGSYTFDVQLISGTSGNFSPDNSDFTLNSHAIVVGSNNIQVTYLGPLTEGMQVCFSGKVYPANWRQDTCSYRTCFVLPACPSDSNCIKIKSTEIDSCLGPNGSGGFNYNIRLLVMNNGTSPEPLSTIYASCGTLTFNTFVNIPAGGPHWMTGVLSTNTSATSCIIGNTSTCSSSVTIPLPACPTTQTCECVENDSFLRFKIGNNGIMQTVECGGHIIMPANSLLIFNPANATICAPLTTSCNSSLKWQLSYNGSLMNQGTGSSYNFTFVGQGIYQLRLIPSCNGQNCPPCIITIRITPPTSCCTGGQWSQTNNRITVTQAGAASVRNISNNLNLTIDGPSSIQVNPGYICASSNCNPEYSFKVGNNPETARMNSLVTAINTTSTRMVIYAWCGGVKCDSSVINLTPIPFCQCQGGSWSNTPIQLSRNNQRMADLFCNSGNPVNIPNGFYQLSPPTYTCSDAQGCQPRYEWEILREGNRVASGNGNLANGGAPFFFEGPVFGSSVNNYTIRYTAYCNGVRCQICEVRLRVN